MTLPNGWIENFPAPEESSSYTGDQIAGVIGNPAGFIPEYGSVKVMNLTLDELGKIRGPQDIE